MSAAMYRCSVALVLVVTAAMMALVGGVAQASVYWTTTQGQGIGRAALDGSNVEMPFIRSTTWGGGVALNGTHIFWNAVARANLDGSGVQEQFAALGGGGGVAVNDHHIYAGIIGGTTDGKIGRANLDGSGANPDFITGVAGPCGVAVNATHVYWGSVNGGTIGRAALDGTGVDRDFITLESGFAPCGVAVDGDHVYWADYWNGGTTIGRANLDGTGVDNDFITGASYPCGVAVHGGHIYWANQHGPSGPSIARAKLDGTDIRQKFIDLSEDISWRPCGVGVDALVKSSTVLQSSATSAPYGRPIEFTATVTGAGPAPTGSVRFVVFDPMRGDKRTASRPVDAAGRARWIPDEPLEGGDSVSAVYQGDAHYASSKSAAIQVSFTPARTATDIEVDPNPVVSGATTDVLITVENLESDITPSGGLIVGVEGSSSFGTPLELDEDGQVAFGLIADVPAGDYTLFADYRGDWPFGGYFQPSRATIMVRVLPASTPLPAPATPAPASSGSTATVPPRTIRKSDLAALVKPLLSALKTRGFKALSGAFQGFDSPGPGTLTQKIYARRRGNATRSAAKPVLVSQGRVRFTAAGRQRLRIKTTPAGRKLTKRARRLTLDVVTRYAPMSGVPVSVVRRVDVRRRGTASSSWLIVSP